MLTASITATGRSEPEKLLFRNLGTQSIANKVVAAGMSRRAVIEIVQSATDEPFSIVVGSSDTGFQIPLVLRSFGSITKTPSSSADEIKFIPDRRIIDRSSRSAAAQEVPPDSWVARVTLLDRTRRTWDAMSLVTVQCERAREQRKFDELSEDLKQFKIEELSHLTLTSLLRNTFSVRGRLPYWRELLSKVRSELLHRNLDAEGLLVGLD
jgi:hypothetical protein